MIYKISFSYFHIPLFTNKHFSPLMSASYYPCFYFVCAFFLFAARFRLTPFHLTADCFAPHPTHPGLRCDTDSSDIKSMLGGEIKGSTPEAMSFDSDKKKKSKGKKISLLDRCCALTTKSTHERNYVAVPCRLPAAETEYYETLVNDGNLR